MVWSTVSDNAMTRKNLISASEIAEVLGIQCQTVYLWVRQKRIPFYRVGQLVKFDESEVLARFKAEIDEDSNQSTENDTLSVRTSRGRQSVRRFTMNHRNHGSRRQSIESYACYRKYSHWLSMQNYSMTIPFDE
jgi:excisionase family DNA binding protein